MIKKTTNDYIVHSQLWSDHFKNNLPHMDHIEWSPEDQTTAGERKMIGRSIATFQLGENSEGNSFRRAGEQYARETGDHEYLVALDMFIKEENRHSDVLGRFMDQHAIPKLQKEWTDSTFRFIRKIAGLNVCISVLLTAEIIASVYYRALGRATSSRILLTICEQILIDEAHHLVFQAGTLAKQRRNWSPFRRWFFAQLQRILMAGTILVVWKEHGSVFRAGGFTFRKMATETWGTLEQVLQLIHRSAIGTLLTPDETQLPQPIVLRMENKENLEN